MKPAYFQVGIEILLANFVVIIIFIYGHLYFKKKKFFYKGSIRNSLEIWISKAIIEDSDNVEFEIPPKLLRIIKNPIARQYAIDEMIASIKNLTGSAPKNISRLYEALGLKKVSLKKMDSRKWHIKARGIQELYLMNQMDVLKKIYKNTNSNNEFVRMEAQTGIIHMTGFDGLRFLDVVSYPITVWQQIKLLEQLRTVQITDKLPTSIPKWLRSSNDTVVIFALKLADEYQQYSLHDRVVSCLDHPNEMVRIQAVKTLVRIANESTPKIFTEHFPKERFTNKLNILDCLCGIATNEEAWFLIGLIDDDESNVIKLKAARVMANGFQYGLEALAERGRAKPDPYQKIYLHIKSEMKK